MGIVEFGKRESVRHQRVKYIVEAFDRGAGEGSENPETYHSKNE